MDSHSPIATRNAGEPPALAGDRFTFAMVNTFKREFSAFGHPVSGFRAFEAARAADCGDGRCRGAHYPAQGYGRLA